MYMCTHTFLSQVYITPQVSVQVNRAVCFMVNLQHTNSVAAIESTQEVWLTYVHRTNAVGAILRQCVALMAGAVIPTICVGADVWAAAIVDQTFILI